MPSLPDPLRRRAPDERPGQIIDAALAVFDERGLAGARLDDIALRAGVAKGTIYLYFPNKEELFREVIRTTLIARLVAAEGEVAAGDVGRPAVEQLRDYTITWWAFLTTPACQTVYRLVVGELHRFPELATFYTTEVVLRARALITQIIRRGVERGEFRPIDPGTASRIMASMCVSHALWVGREPLFRTLGGLTPDEIRDQILDFTLRALRPDTPPPAEFAEALPTR